MGHPRIRIYYGPDEPRQSATVLGSATAPTVTVPLSEICNLLADAVNHGRTWLGDFQDDEVTISSDLYDVLMAYGVYRRPSA